MPKSCPTAPIVRYGLHSLLTAVSVCAFWTNGLLASDNAPRPNILFLYADDLGYGDLGCYGHSRIQSPVLDRLASQGSRFQQFYVSHCVCSPTRASLMTGQYPSRWRIYGHLAWLASNKQRGMPNWLDDKAPSVPRALQQAGYRTAHFGKWHLGGGSGAYRNGKLVINDPDAPPVAAYGFDVVRATFGNAPTWKNAEPVDGPHEIYPYDDAGWQTWSSRAISDATIEFLRKHARAAPKQPFFVQVWFKDVHVPLKPTPEMRKPYQDVAEPAQTYFASVSYMDQQIGRILATLDELGMRQNTLVVFTSDNGAVQKAGGSCGPLRGWKHQIYEGGIRVPLIVRWPGVVPAGAVDADSVLGICDFAPTFCRLAGASMPAGYESDGVDMIDALHGKTFHRAKPLFWHHPTVARGNGLPLAVRDGKWKLLMRENGSGVELYDLSTDVGEAHNLAKDHPDVVDRLRQELNAWLKTLPATSTQAGAT
jgi:arylsulfatase A-like enzyme